MSAPMDPSAPRPDPGGQLLIYRDGGLNLQVRLDGQTVWLTQRQLADLFQVTVPTVNEHLANIYAEGELQAEATIRQFRIVQMEGSRQVSRTVDHYNLDVVLAVGYRVRSPRGSQFRQWATVQLRDLLVKGFVLDDERIKAGRTLGEDYFDELLERIRDIRASERLFYQKITDIYATSIDYDPKAEITQTFFKTVRNKLHWACHGRTAAETIRERADAGRLHMGLTTWKNSLKGAIRRQDAEVAKNYLSQEEITELNRVVTMYLDYAEDQARRKKPMHMSDWAKKLDDFLTFNERQVLTHKGTVSHDAAMDHAHREFSKYEAEQRTLAARQPTSDFDRLMDESRRVQGQLPPDSGEPAQGESPKKSRRRKKPSE